MLQEAGLTHEQFLERVAVLANEALQLWPLPAGATARLINLSENATFLVEASGGYRSVLRVHRQGYHSRQAILSELAWMMDLNQNGQVPAPESIAGRNGEVVQEWSVDGMPGTRYLVLFKFIEGIEPHPTQDLVSSFEELGEIAARTHLHSLGWRRPSGFERLVWDLAAVFGDEPIWGDWRHAPAMDAESMELLEHLQERIIQRLQQYGTGSDRYGLIHADMRLANLLIDNGATRLIDFDDCGSGWFMYDFAASISFMEDHPQVPALKEAWIAGYRRARPLTDDDEAEMDTFVMLRRLALCAWIGTHSEVDIARELAPVFVPVTAELARRYLQQE
ncbi:phosphotransferase enzyme family protein [Granulosicoccus sp. 3-233]|uniref:phosphotransferase enzyme family protein n=1 Tax=Granulosicoccus sp. 3-233 TaxID=3417969 RepID=UPI003D337A23